MNLITGTSVVKELNAFLKGQYMGIHAYENLIQKAEDPEIKKELQKIQQDHKQNAMQVAARIQNLGGRPVNDEGITGSMQNYINQFTLPGSTEGLLNKAIMGEEKYAIQVSEEIVKGDLDRESQKLIEDIIDQDRKHAARLKKLLR